MPKARTRHAQNLIGPYRSAHAIAFAGKTDLTMPAFLPVQQNSPTTWLSFQSLTNGAAALDCRDIADTVECPALIRASSGLLIVRMNSGVPMGPARLDFGDGGRHGPIWQSPTRANSEMSFGPVECYAEVIQKAASPPYRRFLLAAKCDGCRPEDSSVFDLDLKFDFPVLNKVQSPSEISQVGPAGAGGWLDKVRNLVG